MVWEAVKALEVSAFRLSDNRYSTESTRMCVVLSDIMYFCVDVTRSNMLLHAQSISVSLLLLSSKPVHYICAVPCACRTGSLLGLASALPAMCRHSNTDVKAHLSATHERLSEYLTSLEPADSAYDVSGFGFVSS